ncbi:hypothetical protein J1605_003618 [Eschrichtius robustus]|uniref:Ribosomal RNA processing protein 1 A n=1 Tax=Eschrichtius robustus TaxID=9764 RepID=A0AB34HRZ2_ESCRO|nr:hypothetical protein J1605_003618 [Eschrichtius robustus]
MNREWMGIDRLRLDKFYMVRKLPAPRGGPCGAGARRPASRPLSPPLPQQCQGPRLLAGERPAVCSLPVTRSVSVQGYAVTTCVMSGVKLMRLVLHESLKALKTRGWDERQTEQLLELLMTEILHPDSQAPNGVKSHFIEIFLEELTKVGARELTADQNLRFIGPFCMVAARTQDSLVLHNITRGVFEAIVEQAPLAIEELMNELEEEEEEERDGDTPSREPPEGPTLTTLFKVQPPSPDPASLTGRFHGDSHFLVTGTVDHVVYLVFGAAPGMEEAPARSRWMSQCGHCCPRGEAVSAPAIPCYGLPCPGSVSGAEPDLGKEQAGDDEEEEEEDSAGTILQFDYEAVANRLFEMASRQDTPPQNRKRLYKVIRKLQALSEGLFPEDDIPEKAYRNPRGGRRVRMKKRLFESQLQNKIGRAAEEASCPDPSPASGRRRRSAGADPAVPREQPGGCGRRGAPRRRRRPWAGARAKAADGQAPKTKRKRTLEGQK